MSAFCDYKEVKPMGKTITWEGDEKLQQDIGTLIVEYSANEDDYSLVGVVKEILSIAIEALKRGERNGTL